MIYAIATVLVLILDQAVKFLTTKNIPLSAVGDECVALIKGVVHITNIHNYGAAFSILEGARWVLVGVTIVFVIGIIVLISNEIIHTRLAKWSAVMVMAGALGNCIDRVMYGYVVDMFEFEFVNFAVFNVADIFVVIFGILFCLCIILHNEPEEVKQANEPDFIRRRKQEKVAKEEPYADIPKRGEHQPLEEMLRANNDDDPFAEWDFGALVEKTPAEKRVTESAKKTEPAKRQEPAKRPELVHEAESARKPRPVKKIEPAGEDEPIERGVRELEVRLPKDKKPVAVGKHIPENSELGFKIELPKQKKTGANISAETEAPGMEIERPKKGRPVLKKAPVQPLPEVDLPDVPEKPDAVEETFSLEDILSEFGDL